jgi:TolB-like protein
MDISTTSEESTGANASPDHPGAGKAALPDPVQVRDQLVRILGSSEFQGSERTRRFLRYVVEEALAGRADRIKAFSVAVAAFDRDETFNPQTDPIVRIEAGRLRRCLERYYLVAGAEDAVRIGIPKGSYVPDFSWNQSSRADPSADGEAGSTFEVSPASPLRRWATPSPRFLWASLAILTAALAIGLGAMVLDQAREITAPVAEGRMQPPEPSIAVLPFEGANTQSAEAILSSGMTNEIVRELSQQPGTLVLSPRSLERFGARPDITTIGRGSGAAFVLAGDVHHAGEKLRVAVQLSETATGTVIWAKTFNRAFEVEGIFDVQASIAREVAREIAQPQGAIALFDWERTRGVAPESWAAYDCVVQAGELRRRGVLAQRSDEIRSCLNRTVEQEPGYAEAWIMLALLEIDALRYAPQTRISPESLDAAYAAAQSGVDLAPDSGRAHMALMLALFFRGEVERALAVGDVALRLSPQDPDVITEVGLRQVIGGSPDDGLGLLRRAASLYNEPPAGLRLAQSLGYLRKGELQQASDAIDEVIPNSNFIYLAVAAAVYGKAERWDAARLATKELLRLYPDFGVWADDEITQRYLAPDLAAKLVQGWEAAGLAINLPSDKARHP